MKYTEEKLTDLCLELFEIDAIKFGDFVTKVGIKTPIYLDLRGIISYPAIMNTLASIIYDFISKENIPSFDLICGVPYTALPIATAISVNNDVPMVIRRKDVKTYGTKKLVEGVFSSGDRCIIVEDVVTSGSSILETVNDLKSVDIMVTDVVTVVNREQGGADNLKKQGYTLHSLFTMTKIIDILVKAKKIDEQVAENVKKYLCNNQVEANAVLNNPSDLRVTTPFESRKLNAKANISSKLFNIMLKKQSNLVVAVDVTTSSELLSLAKLLGPHVAILKTHSDAVADFNEQTESELQNIAKENDFLIMEDRKLADIGATVGTQFKLISRWAHLVTVHSIAGPGPLQEIEKIIETSGDERGVFLIAELSCEKNLIDEKYTQDTLSLAQSFPQMTVGLVCQSKSVLRDNPELLQMTPGVHLTRSGDEAGQQYKTPEHVIGEKGADLAVVGRGVVQAKDQLVAVKEYQKVLWSAYEKRLEK